MGVGFIAVKFAIDGSATRSARIVAAKVANGLVLAALTLEVYKVYKPAPVYEHVKEQT